MMQETYKIISTLRCAKKFHAPFQS